jgi:peptidoglycan/xylan/chitin deacetylase (PgdA/CDA1 family)/folate-dependent phosphoribosylglycinamide formyltransferase PurN
MRIVVFTGDPALERSPWWPVVLGTPGLSAVLIVRHIPPRDVRTMARRFARNVRRHGLVFVPYRAAVLLASWWHDLARRRRPVPLVASPVAVEEICATDVHDDAVVARVREWAPDLGVSIGAPIMKRALFGVPTQGTLNVHLGRVPEFRGAPPGFWELWHGATEVGATVHWIDDALDTGPMVEWDTAPLHADDTPDRAAARAQELGVDLLARALAHVAAGCARRVPQAAGGLTRRTPTVGQRWILAARLAWRRFRTRAADPAYIPKVIAATAWVAIVAPLLDLTRALRGRHAVRIFTYHRVTDLCRDGMTVSPAEFRRQVAYIRRTHTVVSLDHALAILASGAALHEPLAVFTFDDGYRSVATAAKPVLDEAGVTAACFVNTGLVDAGCGQPHDAASGVRARLALMTWAELAALQRDGWHLGGHTAHHIRLSDVQGDALRHETEEPLAALQARLGVHDATMAYPFGGAGDITADGVRAAREAGFVALFSNHGGENPRGAAPFVLRRIDLGGDHDRLMWKAMARGMPLGELGRRLRAPVFAHARGT